MKIRFLLLVVLLCLSFSGCAHVSLRPVTTEIDPSPAKGRIIIGEIRDLRNQGVGGGNFQLVGVMRGEILNKRWVRTGWLYGIDDTLRDVLANSLRRAGYQPVLEARESGMGTVDTEVLTFWCDGYRGYGLAGNIGVRLLSPTGAPVFDQKISYIENLGVTTGAKPMQRGYANLVREMETKLTALFSSEGFEKAVARR